jgi:hypothetical protein
MDGFATISHSRANQVTSPLTHQLGCLSQDALAFAVASCSPASRICLSAVNSIVDVSFIGLPVPAGNSARAGRVA